MDPLVVDAQGFKDRENRFIVKEFAIYSRAGHRVFCVKPPHPFRQLTSDEKRHVRWVEAHRGIRWNEGDIHYRQFRRTVRPLLRGNLVMVKGDEKAKWVREFSSEYSVVNIEDAGCPNFWILDAMYGAASDVLRCEHHVKHCALKNVYCIMKWCSDNPNPPEC